MSRAVSRLDLIDSNGRLMYRFRVVDGAVTYSRAQGSLTTALTATVVDPSDDLGTDEYERLRTALFGKDGDTYGAMGGVFGVYSQTIQTGVLAPYGVELIPYRGVTYADGTTELVKLGTLQLTGARWLAAGTIALTGRDRSAIISGNTWALRPYQVALDTNYASAIDALVTNRLGPYWAPRVPRVVADTSQLTPAVTLGTSPGGDPWSDICSMARLCGMLAYFDRDGQFVLAPAPDPTGEASAEITTGEGSGTLVAADRDWSQPKSVNGVIVVGQNASTSDPVRGEAYDNDPDSPTYRHGPFGYRPVTISTALVRDSAQAQNLANVVFTEQLGLHEEVACQFLVNPALDVTDVVHLVYPDRAIDATFVCQQYTVPLGVAGVSSATLRRRKDTGDL